MACKECGHEPRDHLRRGWCLACYKRLWWRPQKHQAVVNSDEAARRCKGYNFPVHSRPRRRARCGSCNRFKSRPSSVCGYCGDEPGTYNMTDRERYEYDLAHGWDCP